nr:STAS domain-containing protein [Vibrio salilacus]
MEYLLPENLDISTVLDSTNLYQHWLTSDGSLAIDASNVKRVDAAGLQALTALFASAKSNQVTIRLLHPTELLVESITTLGLNNQLDIHH